jgi:hypothetical protein
VIAGLGGALGGLLGTGLMVGLLLIELSLSGSGGGLSSPTFALAFGGAWLQSPPGAPYYGLPVHVWHGVALGFLLGALLGLWSRFSRLSAWASMGIGAGIGLGIGGFVLGVLGGPGGVQLTEALSVEVLTIHAVFGIVVTLGASAFIHRFFRPSPSIASLSRDGEPGLQGTA